MNASSFATVVRSVADRRVIPALAKDVPIAREFIYFHHEGNRALRMGDSKIVSSRENKDAWELYDLAADRGEAKDLAAAQPERVKEMEARWKTLTDEYARDAARP